MTMPRWRRCSPTSAGIAWNRWSRRSTPRDDDVPTLFIAWTIKGYGLPFAGHKDNHAGLMNPTQMAALREAMGVARRPRVGTARRHRRQCARRRSRR